MNDIKDWRPKIQEIYLDQRDNNSSFFHQFMNHCKKINTVWKMPKEDGMIVFFHENAQGTDHFTHFMKGVTISEVVQITTLFAEFFQCPWSSFIK